jgi:hypothetical protein
MTDDPLATALAHRLATLFDLAVSPPIELAVFSPEGSGALSGRRLDSLDLVEVAVLVENELGVWLHQRDLADVATIAGLAYLVRTRANVGAVARFLAAWTMVDDKASRGHTRDAGSSSGRKDRDHNTASAIDRIKELW